MRNLVIGIATGIATTLAIGAATAHQAGRYQIAVNAAGTVYRLDTQTGAVECSGLDPQTRQMVQIIQPR